MTTHATTWSDEFLDEMREASDPPADAAVAELFGGPTASASSAAGRRPAA
jgi:hypothetical protein